MKNNVVLSAECRSLSVILPSLEGEKKKKAKFCNPRGQIIFSWKFWVFPAANNLFFFISPSSKMGITYLICVEWRCMIPQQRGEVCACQLYKYIESKLFLDTLRNFFEEVQQIMD